MNAYDSDWIALEQCEMRSSAMLAMLREQANAAVLNLTPITLGKLPHVSGLYFCHDKRSCPMYVGIAVDISRRWSGHELRGIAIDCGWAIRVMEIAYGGRSQEAAWIMLLRPKYNGGVKIGPTMHEAHG